MAETQGVTGPTITANFGQSGHLSIITGPSGSGKTTSLRSLFRDRRRSTSRKSWPGAAMFGQNPATQTVADSVRDEVGFALVAAGYTLAEVGSRTERAIAAFGLEGLADAPVPSLSMGWTCRTLLAALHALDADAYFLDEPLAQLDRDGAACLARVIELWCDEGKAVILTAGSDTDLGMLRPPHCITVCEVHSGLEPKMEYAEIFSNKVIRSQTVLSDDALAVSALRVGHGDGPDVLCGLDLQLGQGRLGVVVGRNGSGKSTLLRALTGNVQSRRGQIRTAGLSNPTPQKLAGRVAVVLQNPELHLAGLTVRREIANRCHDPADADILLAMFGLERIADEPALSLSHGQKQMVALAASVAARPRLLLLDEPLCGVDGGVADRALSGLRRFLHLTGASALVATHSEVSPMTQTADHIWDLRNGVLARV